MNEPEELAEYELPEYMQMEQDEAAEAVRKQHNRYFWISVTLLVISYGIGFIAWGMRG